MNKFLFASLGSIPFLVACGSSGSSSPSASAPVYEWQIVQLKSVSEQVIANECIIYADSILNEGEVISAYIAEQDFNVLYHNPDGSIANKIPADEVSNGLVRIDTADVPDDGYVTIEEVSEARGGDAGSYMFSVQKSLLSDLVVNIAQEQDSDCVKGIDYREILETAYINTIEPSEDPDYYQSSVDESNINGLETSGTIPVTTPYPATRDVLITAYADYNGSNQQKSELSHWAFIDGGNLYQTQSDPGAELTAVLSNEIDAISWSTESDISLDSDSGVIAVHQGSAYFWQPIYKDHPDLSVAYDSDEVSLWSSFFSGSVDDSGWLFKRFYSLSSNPTDFYLSELALTNTLDNVSVTTSCALAKMFCIDNDGSYESDDFNYQRLHVRLTEEVSGASNITYQSIYATVNDQPVVLETSLFEYTSPTLTRAEFNLMHSDADSIDAITYLMASNIDLVSVGEYSSDPADDNAESNLFNDINGYVAHDETENSLYQSMLDSDTTLLNSSYQATP